MRRGKVKKGTIPEPQPPPQLSTTTTEPQSADNKQLKRVQISYTDFG